MIEGFLELFKPDNEYNHEYLERLKKKNITHYLNLVKKFKNEYFIEEKKIKDAILNKNLEELSYLLKIIEKFCLIEKLL